MKEIIVQCLREGEIERDAAQGWAGQGRAALTPKPSPHATSPLGEALPEIPSLYRTLCSVVEESNRHAKLVRDLLAATEQSQRNEEQLRLHNMWG